MPRPRPAFQGGPDYHGLLKQIHVAETEEKAIENARQFLWMQGEFTGLAHPVWSDARRATAARTTAAPLSSSPSGGRKTRATARRSKSRSKELMIIAGTPKQVIAKLRILLEETRPGILGVLGQ